MNQTHAASFNTALHYAVRFNQADLARVCLDHGADIGRRDSFNLTPVDIVQRSHGVLAVVFQLFLGRGLVVVVPPPIIPAQPIHPLNLFDSLPPTHLRDMAAFGG